jgi:Protein of unknown function (DUF3822)
MPFLELFDETLDINSTANYEMSIQVGPGDFSFCLLDLIRNKYVLLRSFEPEENKYFSPAAMEEIITKDDFLTRRYRKVNIVMPSPRFTIVPAALFDPGKRDEYFTYNHLLDEGNIIISNKLNDPEAYLVFSVSRSMSDLMAVFYPGMHPFHQVKPLLNHIGHSRKSINGNYIHVHVEKEFFDLIIFDHDLLKFCNSFNYRNINDIIYFVLKVFRSLDLKQEETIYLSGLTEKYDDLTSNLSIYVRTLKFAEPAGNFTFSYVFNDAALHRYLNLFSVINCE